MKLKTKFQDEDFDLGEVVEANVYYGGSRRIKMIAEDAEGGDHTFYFGTLKELNEMFEDYEEPKGSALDLMIVTLTNFIENEPDEDIVDLEDCEQMLKKLKVYKRLKDNRLRLSIGERMYTNTDQQCVSQSITMTVGTYPEAGEDLDLLLKQGGQRRWKRYKNCTIFL